MYHYDTLVFIKYETGKEIDYWALDWGNGEY